MRDTIWSSKPDRLLLATDSRLLGGPGGVPWGLQSDREGATLELSMWRSLGVTGRSVSVVEGVAWQPPL